MQELGSRRRRRTTSKAVRPLHLKRPTGQRGVFSPRMQKRVCRMRHSSV